MEPQAKKRLRVLLVEDHEISRFFVVEVLRSKGCEVQAAENGTTALAMFKPDAYDLVLMDLGLPDIDGLKVTRSIREMEAEHQSAVPVPIVAVSANVGDDPERDQELFEAGMVDWVTKPLTLDRMASMFKRLQLEPPMGMFVPGAAAKH